jgi:hypothetical protein
MCARMRSASMHNMLPVPQGRSWPLCICIVVGASIVCGNVAGAGAACEFYGESSQ